MRERNKSQLHMDIELEATKLGYFGLEPNSRQRSKVREKVIDKLRLADQWPDASEQSRDDNLGRILRKRTSPR